MRDLLKLINESARTVAADYQERAESLPDDAAPKAVWEMKNAIADVIRDVAAKALEESAGE